MHTLARSALIGGAVMVAIATSLALGRDPVPAHTFRDKPFQDEVWREDMATLALISARLEALNMPKLVPTESIKPIGRDPLMMALSTEPAAAPQPKRRAEPDVCQRHGQRKVMIDKYRWRCGK